MRFYGPVRSSPGARSHRLVRTHPGRQTLAASQVPPHHQADQASAPHQPKIQPFVRGPVARSEYRKIKSLHQNQSAAPAARLLLPQAQDEDTDQGILLPFHVLNGTPANTDLLAASTIQEESFRAARLVRAKAFSPWHCQSRSYS